MDIVGREEGVRGGGGGIGKSGEREASRKKDRSKATGILHYTFPLLHFVEYDNVCMSFP